MKWSNSGVRVCYRSKKADSIGLPHWASIISTFAITTPACCRSSENSSQRFPVDAGLSLHLLACRFDWPIRVFIYLRICGMNDSCDSVWL